jgi:predicted dehydrogenase
MKHMIRSNARYVSELLAVMCLFHAGGSISADSSQRADLDPAQADRKVKDDAERFRIGVVGLEHGHIYGFLYAVCGRADVRVVGMAEPQEELLRRYGQRHQLPESIWYRELEAMLDGARPEAVAVFTDTKEHLRVVQACAPRKIHVMVEKPLAASAADAHAMAKLAREHGIHVLVNYETTWYANRQEAFAVVRDADRLGPLRRMVAYTGHPGPKEIGMPREFMAILTDPELNGAGALYDFGCYGAVNMTCLMGGRRPLRVSAVATQCKKDPVYAKVDDDATIVLEYPDAQGVIQASWTLPFNRKDLEIYGERGHFITVGTDRYRLRVGEEGEKEVAAQALQPPYNDSINYLMAVVRGEIEPAGPSSLKINVIVSEILDAARESARSRRRIELSK